MSRQQRLLALAAGVLLVLTGTIASSLWLTARRNVSTEHDRSLSASSTTVSLLTGAYTSQQASEQGFVRTGDETYLEPYVTAQQREAILVEQLRDRLTDPTALLLLDGVVSAGETWRTASAQPAIETRQRDGAAAAAAVLAVGDDGPVFDLVRSRLNDLAARVHADIRASQHSADRLGTAVRAIQVASLAIAGMASGGVLQIVVRRRRADLALPAAMEMTPAAGDAAATNSGPQAVRLLVPAGQGRSTAPPVPPAKRARPATGSNGASVDNGGRSTAGQWTSRQPAERGQRK